MTTPLSEIRAHTDAHMAILRIVSGVRDSIDLVHDHPEVRSIFLAGLLERLGEELDGLGEVDQPRLLETFDSLLGLSPRPLRLLNGVHDSSPSVGGCGDPQPTEGEARKGDSK